MIQNLTFAARTLVVCAIISLSQAAVAATGVILVSGDQPSEVERNVTEIFAQQIKLRSGIEAKIEEGSVDCPPETLLIYLGTPQRHAALKEICHDQRIALPTEKNPGPEGFVLQSLSNLSGAVTIAAAVDERGVLYAVGELLRRMTFAPGEVKLQLDEPIRTAPAFEVRGTEVSQGRTMRDLTGAREWTQQEWEQAVLGYALAGANVISLGHVGGYDNTDYQFVKSLGLKVMFSHTPNVGSGPPEWMGLEAIGRKGYLCPSVPEARAALLKACENKYRNSISPDYVRMNSGDGGGCECERCAPFGGTFVKLCHEMADIVHKYHPRAEIFITNQKLDNAGDLAIFKYLQDNPGDWLRALCYGPGSNAMGWMPGRRQDHRVDLFRYRRFGALDRYCLEIVSQLPPQQSLVFFTDLTHWVYSQYGLMDHEMLADRNGEVPPADDYGMYEKQPDPYLAMVYDRRTFHARPRNYYHVFRETMRYGIGDCTYSEGHHDHFNQWMWQRLLWSPNRDLADVLAEYARLHFGSAAAPIMSEAILQMEENLSAPLLENPGIDRQIELLRQAGEAMPPHIRNKNYLWRQYLQRALLDQYVKLRVRQQLAQQSSVEDLLAKALEQGNISAALKKSRQILEDDAETAEMTALKTEADQLGKESDDIYGVRNVGMARLDRDFVGLGWLKSQIEKAAQAADEQAARAEINLVVNYEEAGPGGFFDDLGNPANSPHVIKGRNYDGGRFSTQLRPSQRTTAFTTDEQQGVTLEYRNLDPTAQYHVRLAVIRPRFASRYADRQPQTSESIYADGELLAKEVELPNDQVMMLEYDIPRKLTADGELKIWLEKSAGVGEGLPSTLTIWRNTGGWGTLASDVWLLKRE